MYTTPVIGSDEAMRALTAMMEEANKEQERPLAFAIVDQNGDLICYARMDRLWSLPQTVAVRKAYTAARMRASTKAWGEGLKSGGRALSDFGDPKLIAFQGGLPVIAKDGTCIGGIGVSGRLAEEDEAIAQIGLQIIKDAE